jgi:hypothetical protein
MNMNKITSLFAQIKSADRIVNVDNDESLVMDITSSEITGEPENEVFYFHWEDDDDDGFEFGVSITEEGLDKATINKHGEIVLIDNEGDEITIRLYKYNLILPEENW